MTQGLYIGPRWSTASFGGTVDTTPMDLLDLRAHLSLCRLGGERWFALRSAAENVYVFLAARQLTTVLVAVLICFLPSLLM